MYKRDLITAEIEKLAQVLARIIGLKLDGEPQQAEDLLAQTLEQSFGLNDALLYGENVSPFSQWLKEAGLPAEKLDMLNQFLFSEITADGDMAKNKMLAVRLEAIYQLLATKHHLVHLANLKRQNIIQQYL